MKLSRFAKIYQVDDVFAYYNSIRIKPVFLTKDNHDDLTLALSNQIVINDMDEIIKLLFEYRILINYDIEDDDIYKLAKSYKPKPSVSVAYFILTEQCNLACKYCFLGNGDKNPNNLVTNYPMSFETAKKTLDYFIYQTSIAEDNSYAREIVFYGGEPLINFKTIEYVISLVKEYKEKGKISFDINYSMVTNGVLINEDIILFLKENNISVSVSIDGVSAEDNKMRVTSKGKAVFEEILTTLELCKKNNFEIGLSVTLTDETIKNEHKMIELLEKYTINQLSFNILYHANNFQLSTEYYILANNFIVKFYEKARMLGIYEDRIMRKLKSFINSELYFSDCAATDGGQIVVTPDGGVGICHGCMEQRDYFIDNISNEFKDITKHDVFQRWSNVTPFNNKECMTCEALGICGGGCPINAMRANNDENLESMDKAFCIHAKALLEFFIYDIYRIMKEDK